MTHYSTAATIDDVNALIDRAAAGETVILKQGSKPPVEPRVVASESENRLSNAKWMERLKQSREKLPSSSVSYLDLKRTDEQDGLL